MAQLYDPFYARFYYASTEEILEFQWTFGAENDSATPSITTDELHQEFVNWCDVLFDEFWAPFYSTNILIGYYLYTDAATALAAPWRRVLQRLGGSGGSAMGPDTTSNVRLSGTLPTGNRVKAVTKVSGLNRSIVNSGKIIDDERIRFADDVLPRMANPIDANGRRYRLRSVRGYFRIHRCHCGGTGRIHDPSANG